MDDGILSVALAVANDEQQAKLINSFARELFVRCGGRHVKGSINGYESQIYMISRHLNADGMQFIADLHAFIELRKKDMA